MDFRKYILETERLISAPVTGDDFDFQINDEICIECSIIEHSDDSYVIAIDERAMNLLKAADLIVEGKMCTECGMGTMYIESRNRMSCDECGYSMTMEAAPIHLMRSRELDIRHDMGDGYWIGSDLHDDGENRKVSYSLYKLENPAGLTDEFVDAWRDVGYLNVSPYRAAREEILAAAAQLKINDLMKKQTATEDGAEDDIAKINNVADYLKGPARAPVTPSLPHVNAPGVPDMFKIDEAEYQGRSVTLGKPSAGDVKKYKVYVRDPKTGNIKKVNFGDKKMSIKRDNPARRKNFRARHNCSDKKDRTSAGYWSCRMWSKKPVSQILKGK